jgi:hypothetical protein
MILNGVFKATEDRVELLHSGESMFSFLCALLWPYIDSYYVTSMVMFTLQPSKEIEVKSLVHKAQWLATVCHWWIGCLTVFGRPCITNPC